VGATASAATVKTMSLGSTYAVRGQTGSLDGGTVRATGLVVVRGKWAKGVWHALTTTRTDAHGNYKFSIKPGHRGLLAIQITPPDKRVQSFLLRIV
jgi:hypothetical protein